MPLYKYNELLQIEIITRLQVNTSPDLTHLREWNITFQFLVADTECDIGSGLFELVEMSNVADAFIGTVHSILRNHFK